MVICMTSQHTCNGTSIILSATSRLYNYKIIYYSSFTHPKLTHIFKTYDMRQETTQPHYQHHVGSSSQVESFQQQSFRPPGVQPTQLFRYTDQSHMSFSSSFHHHLLTTQHFHLNNNFLLVHQIPLQHLP